jgi:hypothetical protein
MLAGLKMDKTILSLSVCHAKAGNTIIILLVLNTIFMRPKATPVSGMYKIPDFQHHNPRDSIKRYLLVLLIIISIRQSKKSNSELI